MEIPLNAGVECMDGPCGQSTAIVVDPKTRELTHFVVHNEEMRPPPDRLVPLDQVVETTHELIRLGCTVEEVSHMAPFVATHYVPKAGPDYSHFQGGEDETTWYQPYASTTVGVPSTKAEEEMVPKGEQALHRGARVESRDGHVGSVGELVVDEDHHYITHFVLQEGHLWGKKEVALPLSAVDHVEGDTVYLKLDKKAIEKLPTIPLKRHYVQGEEDIELMARVFDDPEGAGKALEFVEELRRQGVFKILNAAVLVKDQDGQVTVTDKRDVVPKKGRLAGAITGGLVGLVAGPVGAVVGALAGVGVGGAAAKWVDMGFSEKFLKNLHQYLQPNSSALILLVEHHWAKAAADSFDDLGGMVFQQTLTDKLIQDLLATDDVQA